MSSSETGYAKNAANFTDLMIRAKTFANVYQPPRPNLGFDALDALSSRTEEVMRTLSKVQPAYSKAVDEQELIFSSLDNLVTRSFNYLKVAIANPAELETIKTIADKIRGAVKKTASTVEGEKGRSQAQTSYDNRLENFKRYLDALSTTNVYVPAEASISIATLNNLLTDLQASIIAVALAKTQVDDAQKTRYELFYAVQTGLIDTAMAVKTYVKAAIPKDHPQYKPIMGIKFTRQ